MSSQIRIPEWIAAPIVVTSNSKRQHINRLQSAKWAAWKGVPRIVWRLEISGELAAYLPPRVRERIYAEFPQFTGGFVQGAPGYLTSNINPARGLSNGTAVLFESIELDPREDADRVCNDIATAAEDTDVALTYPPLHINVAVPRVNPADFVEKTLEPGRVVIPVPRFSKWEPVDIKLPGRRQADTFHYRPHGVEQRFAVTVHKIQGQTCNKVILQLNKRSFMPHLTFSMLYVALSRVRTSESIRLMPPHPTGPGLGYLQTLKPTEDLLTWLEGFDPDDGTGSAWNIARAKEAHSRKQLSPATRDPKSKVAATTSTESPIAKPVSTPRRTPNKRKRTSVQREREGDSSPDIFDFAISQTARIHSEF
ncbi:hypothetical protein GHT06_005690 [Daphnia sinensis]|uniref:UvrD-like helicase C-terminal domain-containing protein n=1 Tax=Daphnia sinensis TaxID=1820382 RepID=A0AAD5PLP7_9CRUS|nr:hypothetical protein GHT06_005690 [Daphnia sinensis]